MCKTLVLVFYFFTLPMAGLFTVSAGLDEFESEEQLEFCRRMIWIIYGVCKRPQKLNILNNSV